MAGSTPTTLPLVPLAKDTVLFPGIVLRIPVSAHQPYIANLLAQVYSKAASQTSKDRLNKVSIACVPLCSPLLSREGQRLISEDEESSAARGSASVDAANATKADLFGYGTAAKIAGVEGRGTGGFVLLVEGISRVRIDKITQDHPFFEAEVSYVADESGFRRPVLLSCHTLICYSHSVFGLGSQELILSAEVSLPRAPHVITSLGIIALQKWECWPFSSTRPSA